MAPSMLPVRRGAAEVELLVDDARTAMEDQMAVVRQRCSSYLRWYSPPWDSNLERHDAWEDPVDWNDDAGTTRDNFTLTRAVVDIWTSLEAAKPPLARAEPIHLVPPPPVLDMNERRILADQYALERTIASRRADIRSRAFRDYLRRDHFALKHHRAVRRKNLYGFSWMMLTPNRREGRPSSTVLRNPTTVYPIWNSRDPDDLEAVLSVQQESAVRANAKYGLGLGFDKDRRVSFTTGGDYGRYQEVDPGWFDSTRTRVWIEDFWWAEREYDEDGLITAYAVFNAKRACGRLITPVRSFPWYDLPFVYWQNEDERDEFGWSEAANVVDINDEFNRRISEEADVLGMYAHPRFQLLGSVGNRDGVELPSGDEILPLMDAERIEQILTRIDVYPIQVHVQTLTDMLHRATGLPPIVWGLIANAQTSGRALSASWKATEARLAPKLMANQASIDRYARIALDYARTYDWNGAKLIFGGSREGEVFDDIRWTFLPMEPRDFQEVTMDAITRRDAGLTTTIQAMRDTGDENAEERLEEVKAEFNDPSIHADRAQARLLYDDAQLQLIMRAMEVRQMMSQQGAPTGPGPMTPATVQQAVGQARLGAAASPAAAPPGMEGALPPTAPGAAGNAGAPIPGAPPPGVPGQDETLTAGTLVRNGETSNQLLQTRRLRG